METVFGTRIKELRIAKGFTIKQVAEHLGINIRAYNYYEQGSREPSLETIVLICKFFDVTSDYLIGLSDY